MSLRLELRGVRVPLAEFTLEVDLVLDRPVTTLFGPSGAGKTTLLEVIAGLRRPAAGVVAIDGEVLTDAERGAAFAPMPAIKRVSGQSRLRSIQRAYS